MQNRTTRNRRLALYSTAVLTILLLGASQSAEAYWLQKTGIQCVDPSNPALLVRCPGEQFSACTGPDCTADNEPIVIGVIDTGVEYQNNPSLEDDLWNNPGETLVTQLSNDELRALAGQSCTGAAGAVTCSGEDWGHAVKPRCSLNGEGVRECRDGWNNVDVLNCSRSDGIQRCSLIDDDIDPDVFDPFKIYPDGVNDGWTNSRDDDENGYFDDVYGINGVSIPEMYDTPEEFKATQGDPSDTWYHGTAVAHTIAHGMNDPSEDPRVRIATCRASATIDEWSRYPSYDTYVEFIEDQLNTTLGFIPGFHVDLSSANPEQSVAFLSPLFSENMITGEGVTNCLRYFHEIKQQGVNLKAINVSLGSVGPAYHFDTSWGAARVILTVPVPEFDQMGTPEQRDAILELAEDDVMVVIATGNDRENHDGERDTPPYDIWAQLRASAEDSGLPITIPDGITGYLHNTEVYPSRFNLPNMLSVAATNEADELTSFSSYGAHTVDLAAPGRDVEIPGAADDWDPWSGTSAASPVAASTLGLLAWANPELSMYEVRNLLLSSSRAPYTVDTREVLAGGQVDISATGAPACFDDPQAHSLTARVLPAADSPLSLSTADTVELEAISIECSAPTGLSVEATVRETSPGAVNSSPSVIELLDDGCEDTTFDRCVDASGDLVVGDGNFHGQWTPPTDSIWKHQYELDVGGEPLTANLGTLNFNVNYGIYYWRWWIFSFTFKWVTTDGYGLRNDVVIKRNGVTIAPKVNLLGVRGYDYVPGAKYEACIGDDCTSERYALPL